jgi:hypothetical protein
MNKWEAAKLIIEHKGDFDFNNIHCDDCLLSGRNYNCDDSEMILKDMLNIVFNHKIERCMKL